MAIRITNPINLTFTSDTAIKYKFIAKGGIAPYTFKTRSNLPLGMSLTSRGFLKGLPILILKKPLNTITTTFKLRLKATSSDGQSVIKVFNITIIQTNPFPTTTPEPTTTPTPEPLYQAWLWGYNNFGELGDNTTVNKSSPVQTISNGNNWESISNGESSTAGIKTDGTLWVWGQNDGSFSLPVAKVSSPIQTIAGGNNWKQVSTSSDHGAAVKDDGTLWMWGVNSYGQLGINSTTNKSSPIQTICGGTNWKQVSCGLGHTAAIKTDGTLWSWGAGSLGQLGDDNAISRSSPVQTIAGGTDWDQVYCAEAHTAAIKTDGTLWLWGANGSFQLGDESTNDRSSPIQTVAGGTDWEEVSCGMKNNAAVKSDGTLWLWGANYFGQIGNNTTSFGIGSPVQTVAGGTDWIKAKCGFKHTIGLKNDGTIWSWGNNIYGQLGDNTNINTSSPIQTLSGTNGWINIETFYNSSSALRLVTTTTTTTTPAPISLGNIWGWGANFHGALGDDSTINKSSPVQTLSNASNWLQVETSDVTGVFSSGIKSDGTLWLWGENGHGELGDNTTDDKSSPVQTIAGGTNWSQVSCGMDHTAAIKNDGTLWTWGRNNSGSLGDNSTDDKSSPVQTIAGGTNWKQVSCSLSHTAAIKNDGTLWTWGRNAYGQLGDNTKIYRSSPVQTVAAGTNWKQVCAGKNMTAAIKNNGSLWLWGNNYYGGLGDNTIMDYSSPVQTITAGTNWKQVSIGEFYTAAIKTDGTLWTWGKNSYGQLGDNTVIDKSSPVQTITGGTNWKQVSCTSWSTAAIKTNGTLWTWGKNSYGQLGDNTVIDKSSPVQTVMYGSDWINVSASRFVLAIKNTN